MNLWQDRHLELWWFPPKGKRSLDILWKAVYDGEIHYGFFLWIVHIGYRRLIRMGEFDEKKT